MQIRPRSRHSCACAALVLSALSLAAPLRAAGVVRQEPAKPESAPAPIPKPPTDQEIVSSFSERDARLSPQDIVDVTVVDAPELSGAFTVNGAGAIAMPYLGEVPAIGKTPEELGKTIADGLRGRYLKDPMVTVAVRQYYLATYFIQGAVRVPGAHRLRGRVSLLKLIAVAGGLAENHGTTAFLVRLDGQPQTTPATGAPDTTVVRQVNIAGVLRGSASANLGISPEETVTIPVADVFYVAGEVNSAGEYALKDGTTLRQAITLAQGTKFEAATDRVLIFRDDPATGSRQELRVDVAAVMKGDDPDLPIRANDIIIVPNSRSRSIGGAILQILGANALRAPVRAIR